MLTNCRKNATSSLFARVVVLGAVVVLVVVVIVDVFGFATVVDWILYNKSSMSFKSKLSDVVASFLVVVRIEVLIDGAEVMPLVLLVDGFGVVVVVVVVVVPFVNILGVVVLIISSKFAAASSVESRLHDKPSCRSSSSSSSASLSSSSLAPGASSISSNRPGSGFGRLPPLKEGISLNGNVAASRCGVVDSSSAENPATSSNGLSGSNVGARVVGHVGNDAAIPPLFVRIVVNDCMALFDDDVGRE